MAELKETHRYDDIIHLPHPVSTRHAPMSNADRAAQFSPFAALTGYEDVIAETARQTASRIELEETELQILDQKYRYLQMHIAEQPEITVTYFEQDRLKEGGAYLTTKGTVKKIDSYSRSMILASGQQIFFGDIIHLLVDGCPDS